VRVKAQGLWRQSVLELPAFCAKDLVDAGDSLSTSHLDLWVKA
jgi:hypothetical protein